MKHVPENVESLYSVNSTRSTLIASQSDQTLNGSIFERVPFLRSFSTPNAAGPVRRKKQVSFERCVLRIVLIPTRQEIMRVTADEPIWWGSDDYASFKADAVKELKETMSRHACMDSKAAIKLLYQPDEFDQSISLIDAKFDSLRLKQKRISDAYDIEKCEEATIA